MDKRKSKRNAHNELKSALEGKSSALESLDLSDEEDVYDVVTEEAYAQLVEGRRKESDFVVDDEGLGYYDDGEEHLGVSEDAYEKKKMLKEIIEDVDSKIAKKARKLAEAGAAQKNSMMSFVRTGQTASHRPVAKVQQSSEALLDIDSLLSDSTTATNGRSTSAAYRAPVVRAPKRNVMLPPHLVSRRPQTEEGMNGTTHSNDNGEDGSYDTYADDCNNDHVDSTPELAVVKEESVVMEVEPQTTQRNLSKTAKKMKVAEPVVRPASQVFKPELSDGTGDKTVAGLGLSEIGGLGVGASFSSSGENQSGAINPKLWLQKREPSLDDAGKAVSTEGEEFLNMFWLDACENHGVIYLFGKVALVEENQQTRYVSCCVAVHGAERNLFVLPAKVPDMKQKNGRDVRAGMAETYQDISKLLVPNIVPRSQGQSFRCKAVKRKYAFEHGEVPREETEYLKVVYSANHGVPTPAQCQGNGGNIERIFGATSSALELFLLKRGLMGPCWITINNPRTVPESISWCKLEVGVENPKFIVKIPSGNAPPSPPLVSMCVSMKTVLNPATHVHEIVALSGLIHSKVNCDADSELNPKLMRRFTYVRPLGLTCGQNYPANFPHDLNGEIQKMNGGDVVQAFPNERAMLSSFFARVQMDDPDVFASHNLFGFEFDVLLSRTLANKVASWSKLGRLRRSKPPKSINDKEISAGRILCDTYKASKEFLRETTYSLTHLASTQLSIERVEVDPIDVPKFFSNTNDILKLAHHTALDAFILQKLMQKLQVIPLTKQLTNLSGNLWTRTVRGARAERIEYLLLHEFHTLKYILPEKKAFENNNTQFKRNEDQDEDEVKGAGGTSRTRAKAAYAGGLVLEPKKGLYDTFVLLLDFNSLYPSLIQEYNLCFTTIEWTKFMKDDKQPVPVKSETIKKEKNNKKGKTVQSNGNAAHEDDNAEGESDAEIDAEDGAGEGFKELPPIPDSNQAPGILPRVIKALVDRRKTVKAMLKKERDPATCQQLDIRQKAIKLTANSMYGCLGFSFSRFYARPIAALVTSMGREALQRTVDQATNQFGLDVIYGDTDSVMINTNSTDLASVKATGENVKREVNKLYKSLELDIDGIFKSMLLLKKKKYAAVTISEVDGKIVLAKELKGLDLVRRDWCPLSKNAGKYVVDQILSGNPREDIVLAIHEYLRELSQRIRNGEEDISQFVVTKGLNKNPKDYPDCKGQAHLQVALKMLQANKPVNIGDHIPYVICMQGPEGAEASARAYHPDEILRSNGTLTIDVEWYLTNQILPPIARLCDPIEGASQVSLSQCMGLDVSKFARIQNEDNNDDTWGFTPKCQMDDSERFRDCTRLTCTCLSCKEETEFSGVFTNLGTSGLVCGACGSLYFGRRNSADCYSYLSNRITLLVRQCLKRYYDCWLVCDDPTCGRRSMQQPLCGLACTEDCHGRLVQEFNEESLHTELKYIEALFDFPRSVKRRVETQLLADGNSKDTVNVQHLQQQQSQMVPPDHQEVFNLLKQHMSNSVNGSAYNWVRPSLWTAVFGRILKDNA